MENWYNEAEWHIKLWGTVSYFVPFNIYDWYKFHRKSVDGGRGKGRGSLSPKLKKLSSKFPSTKSRRWNFDHITNLPLSPLPTSTCLKHGPQCPFPLKNTHRHTWMQNKYIHRVYRHLFLHENHSASSATHPWTLHHLAFVGMSHLQYCMNFSDT